MKKVIKFCLLGLLTAMVVALSVIIGMGYKMYRDALNDKSLEQAVAEIRSKSDYTKNDELPQTYLDAVLAVEDHRFYSHFGIDLIATARAAWNDILAGSFVEGGSTVTQQLAKNMFFSQEKTMLRKVAEAFMALKIEREYDKEQILELYVNTIYFGSGYYSVKEACNGYFEIEPEEMDEYQSTLLAGIPNAPSVYALTENPELARQSQKQLVEGKRVFGKAHPTRSLSSPPDRSREKKTKGGKDNSAIIKKHPKKKKGGGKRKNIEAKKEDNMKKVFIFAGAGVIALIGALGWLFMRTKEKSRGNYYESI